MHIVYVAGPYRADNAWEVERNIRRAEEVAFRVAEAGAMPLCPHSMTRYFDGTLTDAHWLEGTMELLRRCDGVVMVRGWEESSGATKEKVHALTRGIPVRFESEIEQLIRELNTLHGVRPLEDLDAVPDSFMRTLTEWP